MFVEKEMIPWDKVVAALSKEINVSDEIVHKLYEYMEPTTTFMPNSYQTPSKSMTSYCKECNSSHSFMSWCVVHVINVIACVCVCECVCV